MDRARNRVDPFVAQMLMARLSGALAASIDQMTFTSVAGKHFRDRAMEVVETGRRLGGQVKVCLSTSCPSYAPAPSTQPTSKHAAVYVDWPSVWTDLQVTLADVCFYWAFTLFFFHSSPTLLHRSFVMSRMQDTVMHAFQTLSRTRQTAAFAEHVSERLYHDQFLGRFGMTMGRRENQEFYKFLPPAETLLSRASCDGQQSFIHHQGMDACVPLLRSLSKELREALDSTNEVRNKLRAVKPMASLLLAHAESLTFLS